MVTDSTTNRGGVHLQEDASVAPEPFQILLNACFWAL